MGARNRERRAAKAKERQRRARARNQDFRYGGGHDAAQLTPRDRIAALVSSALDRLCHAGPDAANPHLDRLAAVSERGGPQATLTDEVLGEFIEDHLELAWRSGWQPADVARVLHRQHGGLPARIGIGCLAAHVLSFDQSTVDERFVEQVAALGADAAFGAESPLGESAGLVGRWVSRTGESVPAVVGAILEFGHALGHLPELPVLCPPPGQARRLARRTGGSVDPKLLERVRSLLAKAEATEYGPEADSLTAKAQELIVRYSIDQALLAAGAEGARSVDEPTGIRIGLDPPYEAEKVLLINQVAAANRCRCVWSRHLGFVTVLGFPADLRAVELLYTSLLVQVTRAMLGEGSRRTARGGSRTRSFRQSFQRAFAVRIGERLRGVAEAGVREGAAGDERLLPVLAGREREVRRLEEELFPDMIRGEYSVGRHDVEGWALGTHAADLAALTAIPSLTDDEAPAAVQEPLFSEPHHP